MNTTNKGPWLVPAWTEASPRLPEHGEPYLLPTKFAMSIIEPVPDMFWNADDTDQSHDSIQDIVATAWSSDEAHHGTVLTIQRAVSLADIKVRVVEEGGNSVTYELVQEDSTTPQGGPL